EDEATLEIYRYMQRQGGIAEVRLRDGRKIYLVRVDPAEGSSHSEADEKARARLTKVLKEYTAEKSELITDNLRR
ncbi:MAG: hypothetical protein ACO2PN_21415, partial [Pyrobaculum sp.]